MDGSSSSLVRRDAATIVIVAGAPRSGSAMLRRALLGAGLPLPDRECRCASVRSCHCPLDGGLGASFEAALRARGAAWDRPPSAHDASVVRRVLDTIERHEHRMAGPWGIRDVRATLFLEALLPRRHVHVIGMYRDPAACVASLLRRETERLVRADRPSGSMLRFWRSPADALKLWTHYNRRLLDAKSAAPERVSLVAYEAVRTGVSPGALLNERAGLALDTKTDTGVLVDPVSSSDRPAWPVPLERILTNRATLLVCALDDIAEASARFTPVTREQRVATAATPLGAIVYRPTVPGVLEGTHVGLRHAPECTAATVHRAALEAAVRVLPDEDRRARLRQSIQRALERLAAAEHPWRHAA